MQRSASNGTTQWYGIEPSLDVDVVAVETPPLTANEVRVMSDELPATRSPVARLDLARRVKNFLYARAVPELNSVAVENRETGVVVVRGRLLSPQSKWMCLACCRRVTGVFHVIDELEVNSISPVDTDTSA